MKANPEEQVLEGGPSVVPRAGRASIWRIQNGLLAAALIAILIFPFVGANFYIGLMVKALILAIFALSLDLLIGYTGLVSFGHAAFFGLSGYTLAILTPAGAGMSIWIALPACLAVTAVAAAAIGWMAVRTSGIYFIMLTLAFAQMLFYFFNDNPRFGGSDGLFLSRNPDVSFGSVRLLDLSDKTTFYYVVAASLVLVFFLSVLLLRAPFGQVIRSIRANEQRTRALGYAVQNYKLASFVIAGTMAGFAGFLEAIRTGIMSPAYLSWHESGLAMIIVILGGMGTLYGAILGAVILVFLEDYVKEVTEHWQLVMGCIIILVVLLLPKGIAGTVDQVCRQGWRALGRAAKDG